MLAFARTLLLLGWSLLRVTVARALGHHRGLAAFRASYRADDLLSLTTAERAFMDDVRGCVACGLCTLGDLPSDARRTMGAPMNLFLASCRSMPDYGVALESFAALDDEALARLELECPARVPMRDLVRFVRTKGGELERSG
jgi:hypothetical protein